MCKAGRGALSWGTADLAKEAGVHRATIVRFEAHRETMLSNITAIVAAFGRHGIVFGIDEDGREHVVLEPEHRPEDTLPSQAAFGRETPPKPRSRRNESLEQPRRRKPTQK